MSVRRVILVVTCVVVVGLGTWFVRSRWEEASKVATLVAALAAVAAVGVAVWAALPTRTGNGGIRVANTGNAVAGKRGVANSGLAASAGTLPDQIDIDRTGEADASGGGTAITGVQL